MRRKVSGGTINVAGERADVQLFEYLVIVALHLIHLNSVAEPGSERWQAWSPRLSEEDCRIRPICHRGMEFERLLVGTLCLINLSDLAEASVAPLPYTTHMFYNCGVHYNMYKDDVRHLRILGKEFVAGQDSCSISYTMMPSYGMTLYYKFTNCIIPSSGVRLIIDRTNRRVQYVDVFNSTVLPPVGKEFAALEDLKLTITRNAINVPSDFLIYLDIYGESVVPSSSRGSKLAIGLGISVGLIYLIMTIGGCYCYRHRYRIRAKLYNSPDVTCPTLHCSACCYKADHQSADEAEMEAYPRSSLSPTADGSHSNPHLPSDGYPSETVDGLNIICSEDMPDINFGGNLTSVTNHERTDTVGGNHINLATNQDQTETAGGIFPSFRYGSSPHYNIPVDPLTGPPQYHPREETERPPSYDDAITGAAVYTSVPSPGAS